MIYIKKSKPITQPAYQLYLPLKNFNRPPTDPLHKELPSGLGDRLRGNLQSLEASLCFLSILFPGIQTL